MIRTIVIPSSDTVSISVPKKYIGKVLEIIAFSKEEGLSKVSSPKKAVTFDALSIDTTGYKFNREQANER